MAILAPPLQSFVEQIPQFLLQLATGLLILLISMLVSSWLSRGVSRAAAERQVADSGSEALRRLIRWSIMIVGSVLAIEQVIPNVTSLLAGLGIAGFTIGFALQDVAKNFVAGVLLLIQRPFEIGDTIEVSGFTGQVVDISLRTTDLRELDGRYVIIPNGDVFVSPIINLSRAPHRRVQVDVGVSYDADPVRVERIALDALQPIRCLVEDPEPSVMFEALGDSAVQVSILFWADMSLVTFQEAQTEGTKAIKAAFERADIDLPFPTQSVLLDDRRAA